MSLHTGDRPGLLLVNLGTPDAPSPSAVRRYLREFLLDPLVIDLPAPLRHLLVRGIILPLRARRSAANYEKIWTGRGSPLRYHGEDLVSALRQRLDQPIALGMRYGNPSIGLALDKLVAAGAQEIDVLPLFPQYSGATWQTAVDATLRAARIRRLETSVLPPFFDHPTFLDAWADRVRHSTQEFAADHVLMSFHGLPERHIRRDDRSGEHCLNRPDCCATMGEANRNCYRAQCFATARGLAQRLDLAADRCHVTFQSRLGRSAWIRPYTSDRVTELARSGCRRLAVVCPAFVADCLETLEEIGLSCRQTFRELGGEDLLLVESLNSHASWVDAVVRILADHRASAAARQV